MRNKTTEERLLTCTPPRFEKTVHDLYINTLPRKPVRPDTDHPYIVSFNKDIFHNIFGKPLFPKLTTQQSLQYISNKAVMFKDDHIVNAPNGVYTWLMYSSKGSYHLIFSLVKTLLESTNKHGNMNMIIGISRKLLSFDDPTTKLWFGGECLKRDHHFTFNFLSGTYMLNFKAKWLRVTGDANVEKNTWFPLLLDMMNSFVSKQDINVYDQQRQPSRRISISYTTQELVNPTYIPFVKSYYEEIEPLHYERYVFANAKDAHKIEKYKKNLNTYFGHVLHLESVNKFNKRYGRQQQKIPDPPEFPKDVNFKWLSEIP